MLPITVPDLDDPQPLGQDNLNFLPVLPLNFLSSPFSSQLIEIELKSKSSSESDDQSRSNSSLTLLPGP